MASISKTPDGRRLIQFADAAGKRRTIRLGKVSDEQAQTVKLHVANLVAASMTKQAPPRVTLAWLEEIDSVMHGKLVAVGLASARGPAATLGAFIDAYIKTRSDVKGSTSAIYEIARGNLLDYFGADRPLSSITPGDADEWRLHMIASGRASNTIRRRCGIAKQFFRAAVRKGVIGRNPFEGIKAAVQANVARMFFVSRETAQKVIDACPDAEWKLIVALSRYGGLRCPSEHFALTWGDVDWQNGRITVRSPKTEHHEGKGSRQIPLFPELLPYLQDAYDQAPEGQTHVIRRYRDTRANLRTQFERIIGRAGVAAWPKLFQNMRSTRETELAETWPLHVVTAWMGNSQPVAAKHYLQVTDEHFERAACSALQKALQQPGANGGNRVQDAGAGESGVAKNQAFPSIAEGCGNLEVAGAGPLGLEPRTF